MHKLLTLEDYWMDRDQKFRGEWVQQIQRNGAETVRRINLLVPMWLANGIELHKHPQGFGAWSSGWRPKAVNSSTPNAAVMSNHMQATAGDIFDPEGDIDEWCFLHQHIIGSPDTDLYMEHPSATKGWCHLQTVPPKSQQKFPPENRRRWFYP